MKRITALILILTLALAASLFLTPIEGARADGAEYLEVTKDGVYLYENSILQEPLFEIPNTYYVKVVRMHITTTYHLVEYNGVEGLVKISEVSSKTTSNVSNPYYTDRAISAHITAYLYAKPSFSDAAKTSVSAYGLNLTYLGKTQGERGSYGTQIWFAVLYTNKAYYIHSANTGDLDILESSFSPRHPNAASATNGTPSDDADDAVDTPSKGVDTVRILLIVGMIVPILVILFLLFRPRRKRPVRHNSGRDRYYSDEDGYDDY